ncbi:MAG: hypothetical protein JST42_18495 [Bacteroidetes bacterium]|nr:hypothetical protein [Bacteroidota bacterium]
MALTVVLSACHKSENVNVSKALVVASHPITSDTLSGSVSGTLLAGRTYYFSSDITINAKDTLLMQAGSKLISMGDGKTTATSPQITCNGTFISLGTADANNYITVPDALRSFANAGKGYWGGIQCGESSGDLILKWTHLEFGGGQAGAAADLNVFSPGDPRNSLSYTNINGNVIIEDCWVFGTQDDGMRILHGHVSIMRNTFEDCGTTGGEALNMKNGVLGDVAYNLVIGAATNAFKISNSGGGPVENKTYLYNNTMLNSGFRQLKSGRGGSIDYEKGASGKIYNNVIVNCRFGMRLTGDADIANISYNNQQFYANDISLTSQFYSADGVGKQQSADIVGAPKANNPLFKLYNVDQFDYSTVKPPLAQSAMPQAIVTDAGYDFGFLTGGPGYQKGTTSFKAMRAVPQGGDYGAATQDPNSDMGAFPTDGSGNKHFTSSLTSK